MDRKSPNDMSRKEIEAAVLAQREALRRNPKLGQALRDPVLGPQIRAQLGMPETPARETRQMRRSRERQENKDQRQAARHHNEMENAR